MKTAKHSLALKKRGQFTFATAGSAEKAKSLTHPTTTSTSNTSYIFNCHK